MSAGRNRGKGASWALLSALVLLLLLVASSASEAAGPYGLRVSASSNRAGDVALGGTTRSGNIYVFTSQAGTGDISQVRFFLDDPTMIGAPRKTETNGPYDFAGGTATVANPFNTATIADGSHTITAAIDQTNATTAVVNATFTVANGSAAEPPDQVHLAWVGDPSTTMTVVWRTKDTAVPSSVEYRQTGDSTWLSASGALRPSGTTGTLHEVTLQSLSPSTAYEYRVTGPGGTWSPVFETHTAPSPGHADFDFVFVADTGLVGNRNTDGTLLATGTQQVVEEIAKLHPLFVLPGGDNVHFSTDKRYGTLNATIDAWFNQNQPIASAAPLMPTYGNHETLLSETFADWAPRFPTPAGFDSRRDYSFDVGDVHFVSLFAVENTAALPAATLTWLKNDLAAAKAAGQRWLIPYMHVSSFADGLNHPSNVALRAQLAPVFEQAGVKLVLMAHDQAFERSWPLTGVTSTAYTVTSHAPDCYTTGEGVTWATVSPGGLLSNQNSNFSQFAHNPAPAWTAVRNNTLHHFALLHVSAGGQLSMTTYGVKGDGTTPVVQDQFTYTTGVCTPALSFSPPALSFSAAPGDGPIQKTLGLGTNDGTPADWTVSADAPWLTVDPPTGTTPTTLTVTADPTGLAPGTYTGAITADSTGYTSASATVTLSIVQPGLGSWTTKAPLPAAIRGAGGAALSGKLYFVAGRTSTARRRSLYVYTPATNKWATKASLPTAYPTVEGPAAAAYNGKLYVFGGQTGSTSGAKTSAAVYSPSTNTWKMLASMPVARGGATAQAIGTKIYVVGGLDATGGSLASVSVYDPAANSWSSAAPMAIRRDRAGSAVLGGKLFIFGGRTRNADGTTPDGMLASVEVYDPVTNSWTGIAPMPTGRRGLAVGTLNGKAQVMGGEQSATAAGTFAQNEEYDPVADSWRTLAAMPTPRQGAVAGTISGVVYVAGGGPQTGTSYSSVNEAFTP